MSTLLVRRRWRWPALAAVVAGVLLVAVLGAITYHSASTAFDNWTLRKIYPHIGTAGAAFLIDLSTPQLSFGVLLLVAIGAALMRRWDLVLLSVLGPTVAVLLSELVLKPVVGRLIGPYVIYGSVQGAVAGAYPSGHETGVTAAAVVLLIAAGQFRLPPAGRVAVGVVLAGWTALAAVGLVRSFYHYPTDTIGGFGVSVAVLFGSALLIDRYRPKLNSPDARSPASTSHAA